MPKHRVCIFCLSIELLRFCNGKHFIDFFLNRVKVNVVRLFYIEKHGESSSAALNSMTKCAAVTLENSLPESDSKTHYYIKTALVSNALLIIGNFCKPSCDACTG
jgi:hypothetical protein